MRSGSSGSRCDTWLRSSPPRNANGVSAVATNAAQKATSPPPARATVTSRNVPSAHTYTGVSCSRSKALVPRQRCSARRSTTTNSVA